MFRTIVTAVSITAAAILSTQNAFAQAPDIAPRVLRPMDQHTREEPETADERAPAETQPADGREVDVSPSEDAPPPPRLDMQVMEFERWVALLAERTGGSVHFGPGVSAKRRQKRFLGGLSANSDVGAIIALCRANGCNATITDGRVMVWRSDASATWQIAGGGASPNEALDQQELHVLLQLSPEDKVELEDATAAFALSRVGASAGWCVFAGADVVDRQPLFRLTGDAPTVGGMLDALADQSDALALVGPTRTAVLVDAAALSGPWQSAGAGRLRIRACAPRGGFTQQWFVGGTNAGRLESEIHALASNGGIRIGMAREVPADRWVPGFQARGELVDVIEAWRLSRGLETDFDRDRRGGFVRVESPTSEARSESAESGR